MPIALHLLLGVSGWYFGYFVILGAFETFAGEQALWHLAQYESRAVAKILLADALAALPWALASFAVVSTVMTVRQRRLVPMGSRRSVLTGVALGAGALAATVLLSVQSSSATRPLPGAPPTRAHFLLIGGGPSPKASQAQIEFNVEWVLGLLRKLSPTSPTTVWFGDGPEGSNGAIEMLSNSDGSPISRTPASTFLGAESDNRLRIRPHRIRESVGTTERDSLLPVLSEYLRGLRNGDGAMIIYNGHGGWHVDRSNNTLRLWNETSITVRDFSRLLAETDSAVPVRFVLPQCFSGSFAKAVYMDADPSLELLKGQRCGFLAESEDRLSEGCSASINLGDYRDYTTYFFAALTGEDRLGRTVPLAPDRDGDGAISPYDAHLHTVLEGHNGDLPRSTSEDWLERYLPWDARWTVTGIVPDNIYGRLARELAERDELPVDGAALGRALSVRYDSLFARNIVLLERKHSLEEVAEQTRVRMRARGVVAMDSVVVADSEWPTLERAQSELDALEPDLVELDRRLSALDKLRRTRMLARALHRLEQRGSESNQNEYRQLRACEAMPLVRK